MDLEALPIIMPLTRRTERSTAAVQWPTLAVALAIHGGFVVLTLCFNRLPLFVGAPIGALLLAWYGSFQHETIHGHPTRCKRFNRFLGSLPLSVWIPYAVYRETHLRHHRHRGRHLTEVDHDPESYYLPTGTLTRFGPLRRWIHSANCTLAGRLIFGPAISISTFAAGEWRRIVGGDRRRLLIWTRHAVGVGLVFTWTVAVCHIPAIVYLALVVYPSVAVTQLRSFAEHHAHADPRQRTRVVEAHPLWGLIFLNNNLHIAHHAYPRLPWYQLPGVWRRVRPAAWAHGLVFQGGYWEVMRKYLFRRFIDLRHDAV